MEAPVQNPSITYSLADQSFARTKSIGILNVSVDLLQAMAQREECGSLTVLSNHTLTDRLGSVKGARIELHNRASGGGLGRIWWDQLGVYSAAQRAGNDWLFLPKGFASFARKCPVRLATFVHDVMQDHYDRTYPDAVSGLEAKYFRAAFRASLEYSDVIFAPSEFTINEIKRVALAEGRKLPRLVCSGEGFARPPAPPVVERRDIIVLASRFPHKLTRRAVEFLTRWCRENPFGEDIHWIGSLPDKLEIPSQSGWKRHTPLPEKDFRTLMSRSRAVLFFSDYEGFGRPPVEAALAGSCPVYSDLPVTREVMADCGHAFDNSNYGSFAKALDAALSARPEQVQAWAKELAERHNWDSVAGRVLEALAVAKENPHA